MTMPKTTITLPPFNHPDEAVRFLHRLYLEPATVFDAIHPELAPLDRVAARNARARQACRVIMADNKPPREDA